MTTYTTQHEADLATGKASIQAWYEECVGMLVVIIDWPDGAYSEAQFAISDILSEWDLIDEN